MKIADAAPPAATRTVAASTFATTQVEYILDPAHIDRAAGVQEIPVRIRNTSDTPMCGSLIVQVTDLDSDRGVPQILNATNHQSGKGAEIDYSRALGDFRCLDPAG